MSTLLLAGAYVFLLLLLILVLLRSELPLSLKAVLVALCGAFYIWHYAGLQDLRGWPAREDLPPRFEMLSRVVIEPNRKRDETGAIYLWVRDLDGPQLAPRAYRLPYSRETHSAVDDTMKAQRQGQRFVGRPARQAGSDARGSVNFERIQRERENLKPGSG